MKKLLAVVAAVACATAFATGYTWTGAAGDNLWANKDNWGGTDYPKTDADTATIPLSATITFDGGADMPLKWVRASGAGVVVRLNAAEGSSIQFAASDAGPGTASGAELYFNVPASSVDRLDPSVAGGPLHWCSRFDKATAGNAYLGYYNCTYFFEGTSESYFPCVCDIGWGGVNDKSTGVHATYTMVDQAKVIVTNAAKGARMQFPGYGSTNAASVDWIQDGDETELIADNIHCGAYLYATTSYNAGTYGLFNLKSGTAKVLGALYLGSKVDGRFVQEGGTFSVDTMSFQPYATRFAVLGGSFKARTISDATTCPIELSNCTFSVTTQWVPATRVIVSGPVAIDVPTGVTVNLKQVEVVGAGKITKTGEGALRVGLVGETTISDGTLDFASVGIGCATASGLMTIDGGALVCGYIDDGSNGRLVLDDGTLSLTAKSLLSAPNLAVEFNGGTVSVADDVSIASPMAIGGTVTFDVPGGKTLTLAAAPEFGANAKIVKTGAGTLAFGAAKTVWRGDLEIIGGTVSGLNRVENPDGDSSVHTVTIRDGAVWNVTGPTATAVSQWHVPVKLLVYGEGYVRTDNTSDHFMCRELWTNGVKAARGALPHLPLTTAGAVFRGSDATSSTRCPLIVSYTWTGDGDGETWSNADNWADKELPVEHLNTTFVDLTDCARVKLTANVDIGGILTYRATGDKTTVVEADTQKTLYQLNGNYYFGGYVAEDRELVFRNVIVKRSETTGNSVGYMLGRGRTVFTGNLQGFPNYGHLCRPCYFRHATNTSATASIYSYTLTRDGGYFFDEGTDLKFDKLMAGLSGHSVLSQSAFLPGCKVTFSTGIYASRHHGMPPGATAFEVRMEGGDVTVTGAAGLSIGTSDYPTGGSNGKLMSGDFFRMTGGTLTVKRVGCECNSNHGYLYGGTLNVGAGGFVVTDSRAAGATVSDFKPNTDEPIVWGGTTVHATESFDFALDAKLVSDGGQPTIDVPDGLTVTVVSNLSGGVSLAKTGAGDVVFARAQPISMCVTDGAVSFADGADLTAEMETLVLADEANLTLAEGQTLKVKALVVNGEARQSGVWGEGAVVVSGDDDWLAPAKVTKDCTITLDAAKDVADFRYAYAGTGAGTLTIQGTGSVAVGETGSIYVRTGDTLVFKVPVSVANTRFSITGGGDVIFEGGFSSTKVNTQGCVRDGTCVVICSMAGENGQLALFAVTSAAAPRMSKIRIEANGTLNQYVYWPTCSANDQSGTVSVGGTCEILTGGRLNLLATNKDNQMFAYKGTETVVLDGGTVSMLTATTYKGGTGVLDFRSGAVEIGGDLSTVIFPREIPLQIGGEVTFDVESDAGAAVAQIAAPITGAGTFVKAGAATLALTGVQTGLAGYRVEEGTLVFGESAEIEPDADLAIAADATVALDYIGSRAIRTLHLKGKGKKAGVYSSENCPFITGGGTLTVTESSTPGLMLIVR